MLMILAGFIFGLMLVTLNKAHAQNACNPGTISVAVSNGANFTIYDYSPPETAETAARRWILSTLGVASATWTEGTTNAGTAAWVYNGNNLTGAFVCDAGTIYDTPDPDPPDPPASSASSPDALTTQQSTSFLAYGLLVVLIGLGYIGGRLR